MTSEGRDDSRTEKRSNDFRFKLVWWEPGDKCGTAYGDGFWVDTTSALLHFSGSHGLIVLPTKTMTFILK